MWLRHPRPRSMRLNARQVADIREVGPKQRTRGQCAMTHFDEAGAIVWLSGADLRRIAWDAHDWEGLFATRSRAAWGSRIAMTVIRARLDRLCHSNGSEGAGRRPRCIGGAGRSGKRDRVSVGPATARSSAHWAQAEAMRAADAISESRLLARSAGIASVAAAGRHSGLAQRRQRRTGVLHGEAPCFRPLRPGRSYAGTFGPRRMSLAQRVFEGVPPDRHTDRIAGPLLAVNAHGNFSRDLAVIFRRHFVFRPPWCAVPALASGHRRLSRLLA